MSTPCRYIDFSSGIYVTGLGLGFCHPKVTEAVQRAAGELMNAHDSTTPIKMRLLEKLVEITPGKGLKKLNGLQLYDSGTTAVEAGLRVMRAATGKFEFISFHRDFHGRTMGAVRGLYPHGHQRRDRGRAAGTVLEPIQGWAGSVAPPNGWVQKIRALCDEHSLLLMADEVLPCMGRLVRRISPN